MSALRHPWVHFALRLALGGFFLYASLDKIAAPAAFARIVYQWQVAGPVPSNLVAVILPWVEALAGVLLIAGLWKREAAAVIAMLLLVFIVAAGSVMARGIDVENCGCVSTAKTEEPAWWHGVGWFLVARNLALLGAALVLIRVEPRAGVAKEASPVPAPAP
ncbi:MAG TPA: MauE/DoxX family redox-associated membrane protein [Vicinamibacteria bacterium]|nr:MauE/DoxX family redox-associated membrane protein [Vicinamibacteria bacterium]